KNDPRLGLTQAPASGIAKYSQSQWIPINNATHIHLRLAEVYLIYAEAAARISKTGLPGDPDFDDAVKRLNFIRKRVGLKDKSPSTRKELLQDIRIEKLLELWGENGESWFDIVRYAVEAGDVSFATNIKPSIKDEHQYIMPIPYAELGSPNGDEVIQNPGYPRTF